MPAAGSDLRQGVTPVQHRVLDTLESHSGNWLMMSLAELISRADDEATAAAPDYVYLAAISLHIAERHLAGGL